MKRHLAPRGLKRSSTISVIAVFSTILALSGGVPGPYGPAGHAPPERQSEPSWSPDATRIAFRGGSYPDVELWTARSDGTELRRLTDNDAADGYPVWSPDGERIAFVSNRTGEWKLYVMDADGQEVRELVTTSDAENDPTRPAWSPDGREIVVRRGSRESGTRLEAVPVDGGPPRVLTEGLSNADWPDVSPGGETLAFVSSDGSDVPQVWRAHRDGTGPRPITDTPLPKSLPRITPDGEHVVYLANADGTHVGWEFFRTRLDGSKTVQITDDDRWKFYPVPSPDGEKILYVTLRGDDMGAPVELWIMDADGGNARPVFRR